MALPTTGQAQGLILGTSQKSGQPAAFQSGWNNEQIISALLPRYSNLVQAGVVFSAFSVAYAALTAAGTTTTGLTVFNPPSSGKNFHIIDTTVGFTPVTLATLDVSAILASGPQTAAISYGTAVTPKNSLLGSSVASAGTAGYGSTTITPTPTGIRLSGNMALVVLTTSGGANASLNTFKDEISGSIVLPPGQVLTFFGLGTVADATSIQSITWAELPI